MSDALVDLYNDLNIEYQYLLFFRRVLKNYIIPKYKYRYST